MVHISFLIGADTVLENYAQRLYVSLNGNAAVLTGTPVKFQLIRPGLTRAANTVSIMFSAKPDWYLRHSNYRLSLVKRSATDLYSKDATFSEHKDSFYAGFTSFESVNFPGYYVSTNDKQELFIVKFQDTTHFKKSASFSDGKPALILVTVREATVFI